MSNFLSILNFLNSEKCLPIVLPTELLILFFLAPWSNIRSMKGEQDAKKEWNLQEARHILKISADMVE